MDQQGRPVSRRTVIRAGTGLAVAGLAGAALAGRREPDPARARLAADAKPSGLTLQQQAGQRVICSYAGLTPPSSLLDQIKAGEAAGVIFITGNIASEAQIIGVIRQLAEASEASPVQVPLLLMTDQEGGEVRRLPGAPALSEKQIGASKDYQAAAAQGGTGAGDNLAGVGMNTDLAPVLDVYRKPGDFDDQYQRSYSMTASVVEQCGQACINAMQTCGVVPTAKHFPGLGAATASQDTDTEPVTLNVPLATLRSVDELPYHGAIAAGVPMIMVSWAVYPALDAKYPAGLSSAVVQGELRGHLGYQGVTITDALEAGALRAFGTTQQRAVAAAAAGMDLIMCAAGDPTQNADAVSGLAAALQSGQLNAGDFAASVQRVTALRGNL